MSHSIFKNIKIYLGIILMITASISLKAQITVSPSNPTTDDTLTIIFDAGKGNKGLYGIDKPVYLHTGVITANSRDNGDWKFVVGNWGTADNTVKMQTLGGDKYSFSFHPKSFYNLPDDVKAIQLAFVFRDTKGKKVGKTSDEEDILLPINGYKPPVKEAAKYIFEGRKLLDYSQQDNDLNLLTDHGTIQLKAFNSQIIQVIYYTDDNVSKDSSHAVIIKPEEIWMELTDHQNHLQLNTQGIQVKITKEPFQIQYFYKDRMISGEELGFFERTDNTGIRLKLKEDESIYGTGERAIPMDVRNNYLELYNRPDYNYGLNAKNLNYTIPLVISSDKYMILFDNPQKGYLDIGYTDDNVLEFGAIGGRMNYYLIAGDDYEELLNEYTILTGRQPIPPRWALGNLQSRMAYRTQAETERIVAEMKKQRFPIDAIILDFYWFGDSIKGYLGNLDWYKPNWPEPVKMIKNFSDKGVKTILITEPFVIDTTRWFTHCDTARLFTTDSLGNTFVNKEFYFGNAGLIDLFKPKAGDWFWEQYNKQELNGVAGWWGDLGEPESHPSNQFHINGSADEVHNIYGHYWEKMLSDKYAENYPEKRLFHLNRSGYAGSQRFLYSHGQVMFHAVGADCRLNFR
ncbi:MAG: DUF4968 domain-containing protein [Bacteroidales bacterium]|nr:DUF4968 domain-containing protein [Bacteroidales bacterium]